MGLGIGVFIAERIAAGAVSNHAISGSIRVFPEDRTITDGLVGVPVDQIVQTIVQLVKELHPAEKPDHLGLGLPGIVSQGVIEDSPNVVQLKGARMQTLIADAFAPEFGNIAVSIFNDADAVAAGMAAIHGHLDRMIRVWTLGNGVGFGRYPFREGVWEAGHSVVSLDVKESYCGCGGKGHLEGIMGQRAMRLRFMDMEPEEIFDNAKAGNARCSDFVKLWHRALAAGTATSIHQDGPGKFFFTGFNARFVNLAMLSDYLHDMVKLSPLQGYSLEVVPGGEDIAVIGAAVNASQIAADKASHAAGRG